MPELSNYLTELLRLLKELLKSCESTSNDSYMLLAAFPEEKSQADSDLTSTTENILACIKCAIKRVLKPNSARDVALYEKDLKYLIQLQKSETRQDMQILGPVSIDHTSAVVANVKQ